MNRSWCLIVLSDIYLENYYCFMQGNYNSNLSGRLLALYEGAVISASNYVASRRWVTSMHLVNLMPRPGIHGYDREFP